MKRYGKYGILLLLMFLLTFVPVQALQAAGNRPGNVKRLQAKAVSETSIKLTWSSVSGAKGYRIYRIDEETGAKKGIANTKKTTYTLKNLPAKEKYTYQVYAYKTVKGKTYYSEEGSPKASAKTYVSTPGAVKNFRVASYGNKSVTLKWNKASKATGYILYHYDSETKTYKRIGTTRNAYVQIKNLKSGETYRFKIKSYRKVKGETGYGKLSGAVKATAKTVNVSAVHGRYFNATVKKNTTATVASTGKTIKLKKGTKVTSTSRGNHKFYVFLKDGTKIRMYGSALTYNSMNTTKKSYSKAQKEAFVNTKGYKSDTNYLIWINQYTLQTNVFKGSYREWKLVRSMPCVVGKMGKTPLGEFKLLFKDHAYGGVRIYFTWNSVKQWGNAFHRRTIAGVTRAAASDGCIRLSDGDLSFIAKNCPMGTKVVSY